MGFPIDLPSSPEEEETNLSIIISLRDLRLIKYPVRIPLQVWIKCRGSTDLG